MDSATVAGRPVLAFSLSLSYSLSGTKVWGYHFLNLLIHLLGALALYYLVRLTLESRRSQGASSSASSG